MLGGQTENIKCIFLTEIIYFFKEFLSFRLTFPFFPSYFGSPALWFEDNIAVDR